MGIHTGTQGFIVSTTVSAGTTSTSSTITNNSGLAIVGNVSNGGTGPTTTCSVTCQASVDGSNWQQINVMVANATANSVNPFKFNVEPWYNIVRLVYGGNTGQSVTITADSHLLVST